MAKVPFIYKSYLKMAKANNILVYPPLLIMQRRDLSSTVLDFKEIGHT